MHGARGARPRAYARPPAAPRAASTHVLAPALGSVSGPTCRKSCSARAASAALSALVTDRSPSSEAAPAPTARIAAAEQLSHCAPGRHGASRTAPVRAAGQPRPHGGRGACCFRAPAGMCQRAGLRAEWPVRGWSLLLHAPVVRPVLRSAAARVDHSQQWLPWRWRRCAGGWTRSDLDLGRQHHRPRRARSLAHDARAHVLVVRAHVVENEFRGRSRGGVTSAGTIRATGASAHSTICTQPDDPPKRGWSVLPLPHRLWAEQHHPANELQERVDAGTTTGSPKWVGDRGGGRVRWPALDGWDDSAVSGRPVAPVPLGDHTGIPRQDGPLANEPCARCNRQWNAPMAVPSKRRLLAGK